MISLTKEQVPEYLVGSEFYNSLSADDIEVFSIPEDKMKPTVSIASIMDLTYLLEIFKFWGVPKLLNELFDVLVFKTRPIAHCESGQVCEAILECQEINDEFQLLHLYKTVPVCSNKQDRLDAAIRCGNEAVLEYVFLVDGQVNGKMVKAAAENGFLRLLERIVDNYPIGQDPFASVSSEIIAARGYSECLLFVLGKGCSVDRTTCSVAAQHGHLSCLKAAYAHGCELTGVVNCASLHGEAECLQYALEQGCSITAETASFAERSGVVDCLRLVHLHGGTITADNVGAAAAMRGNVECLEYVLQQSIVPTGHMCQMACTSGSMACLQILSAHGAIWNPRCAREASSRGYSECLQYVLDEGCFTEPIVPYTVTDCIKAATEGGHVQCLTILKALNTPLANHQHEAVLRKPGDQAMFLGALLDAGYYSPEEIAVFAARNGNIHSLMYILGTYGCEPTAAITSAALHRCASTTGLTAAAIHKRGLRCLKYALQLPLRCEHLPGGRPAWRFAFSAALA